MSNQNIQLNRIEGPLATHQANAHSGLIAYANDAKALAYYEGSGVIQRTFPAVILSGVATNDVMKYNGTDWVVVDHNVSFTFSIASFTDNGGSSPVEIGTGEWKAIGALSFSATYSNGPATGGYVSHTGWSNLPLDSYVGPTVSTESVAYPSVGGSRVFTLNSTNGTTSTTNSNTYVFYNYRYWGVDSNTSLNEAQIEALAGSELSNTNVKSITVTAGVGEYIYYSYPSRLGTSTFTVTGFEGGFESPDTVSVTNSKGFTEDYYVYRSTNSNLATVTVEVT